MYTKNGKTVEAVRVTADTYYGEIEVPAGYWAVTVGGKLIDAPSDARFQLEYVSDDTPAEAEAPKRPRKSIPAEEV